MIAIGGSLGGCEALCAIMRGIPQGFPLPIAVTLHRHPDSTGMLAPIVQRHSILPVFEVEDKMPIEPGKVYLAPPDYHLLIDRGRFSLSIDELVNFARPSIDVFFDSALDWNGRALIAVVLSGASSDGAAGARKIKQAGGTVLVQRTEHSPGNWMPQAALQATNTPHHLSLDEIADFLVKVAGLQLGDQDEGTRRTAP